VGGVAAWRGGTGGGCRWCGFWQSGRVQYNDPAVNRHLSRTRPHSGQATGAPEKVPLPGITHDARIYTGRTAAALLGDLPKRPGCHHAA